MTRKSGWLRFGFLAVVLAVAMTLAVATVAVARVDEFGGAPTGTYAPFTPTDETGRALGYWPAYEEYMKPFAAYTERYAATANIGPHVPSDQIVKPRAPYREFWGQYLEW